MRLPSKSANLQNPLRVKGTREQVQEFPLGRADSNVGQTIQLIVFPDFFQSFVLREQERIVVSLGPGPNLLSLWG